MSFIRQHTLVDDESTKEQRDFIHSICALLRDEGKLTTDPARVTQALQLLTDRDYKLSLMSQRKMVAYDPRAHA